MLTFTLQPLVGIGPIKFGMTRGEVREILANFGQPTASLRPPSTDCFFQNAFQVHYDEEGRGFQWLVAKPFNHRRTTAFALPSRGRSTAGDLRKSRLVGRIC